MGTTLKRYYCPTCGYETSVETNHFGEIYSGCKRCGSIQLYCKEYEGIAALNSREQIIVKLEFYRFNIGIDREWEKYKKLTSKLESNKTVQFAYTISLHKRIKELKKSAERGVVLYDPMQFKDQFVSNIGRIYSWEEMEYDNKLIKEGYFINFLGNEIR